MSADAPATKRLALGPAPTAAPKQVLGQFAATAAPPKRQPWTYQQPGKIAPEPVSYSLPRVIRR